MSHLWLLGAACKLQVNVISITAVCVQATDYFEFTVLDTGIELLDSKRVQCEHPAQLGLEQASKTA